MRFAAESTPRCGALHDRAALVRITFEKSYTHYKRVSSPTPPPPKIFTNVVGSEGAAVKGRMSLKGSLPGGKRRSAEQAARAPRPNGKRIKLHPLAAYRRAYENKQNTRQTAHAVSTAFVNAASVNAYLSTRIWGKVCPATQHLSKLLLSTRICQRVPEARCVRQHCICQHCIWTVAPGRR